MIIHFKGVICVAGFGLFLVCIASLISYYLAVHVFKYWPSIEISERMIFGFVRTKWMV